MRPKNFLRTSHLQLWAPCADSKMSDGFNGWKLVLRRKGWDIRKASVVLETAVVERGVAFAHRNSATAHVTHNLCICDAESPAKPPRGQLSRIGTAHEPPPASTSTAWPFVNSMFVNYTIAPGPMSNVRVRLPSITTPARPTTEYKLDRDVTANKRPR